MYSILSDATICSPKGFIANGGTIGIKKSGNPDLAILKSIVPARCFGVFTQNKVKAAPVKLCERVLKDSNTISALIVNSGNANACTGLKGVDDARRMAELTAESLGVDANKVLVCSTGIIGHNLPMEKLEKGISEVSKSLNESGGNAFADAILTTDLIGKQLGANVSTEVGNVMIGGCCKGSGMIHPNMATMLAFITTDIELPTAFAAEYKEIINDSFNSITVDGDTSTNDTCLLIANGQSKVIYNDLSLSEQGDFRKALYEVLKQLAIKIVLDGEGATKLVEILVKGARTKEMARNVSRFVGNSSLVKTAMFGEDPNWGRLLSSTGSSGEDIDGDAIDIYIGEHNVVKNGCGTGVAEDLLKKVVSLKEYTITINLNLGSAKASAWCSDLSYEYIRINAEYST